MGILFLFFAFLTACLLASILKTKSMRKIDEIIVHCSDSDIAAHDNIATIKKWHTDKKVDGGRGWKDVGYHFFIQKNGSIEIGRPLKKAGAHCYGHNANSVGVCLSGKKKFTQRQFDAFDRLVAILDDKIGITDINPHSLYSETKTCPNFDINEKFKSCQIQS